MRRLSACALVLAVLLAAAAPAADDAPAVRVLFVGNSLTYVNDLPAMIEAVAAQAGVKGRVTCRAIALPDFGLEEHWNDGRAVGAIRDGRWTYVVLQQGPTSLPESESVLRTYTKKFAFEARAHGASVALYSVWPPLARFGSFDAVTASYAHAAADVGGLLVPVGEAWRAAWRRDQSLGLYGPDGFHPSPLGTYIAALVFFERLTGHSPVGLPDPASSRDPALAGMRLTATIDRRPGSGRRGQRPRVAPVMTAAAGSTRSPCAKAAAPRAARSALSGRDRAAPR